MLRSEIEFASFLTYSVRGDGQPEQESRIWRDRLKHDRLFGSPPELTSQLIAEGLSRRLAEMPFVGYFGRGAVLVPVPSSSKLQKDGLWVPQRIARELVKVGLGDIVDTLLERSRVLPKAAWSPARERPTAQQHYDSLGVTSTGLAPARFVLIDDVITRGATMLGAASRLGTAFPNAEIRCFAVMRSISEPLPFTNIFEPVVGKVELKSSGGTVRRP
mgnify:CR=1 FL=1